MKSIQRSSIASIVLSVIFTLVFSSLMMAQSRPQKPEAPRGNNKANQRPKPKTEEELKKEAEALAKTAKFPIKVIGYSDEIERMMQSANVMISKLGGLTTFEALACRLPIIADATTPPMPQEAGTVNMIKKCGAGILLEKASDIVPTLQNLLSDTKKYREMKAATVDLAIPNSTEFIIREIAALLPQHQPVAPEVLQASA